jgi:sugar phosphate isomerase/epimerase
MHHDAQTTQGQNASRRQFLQATGAAAASLAFAGQVQGQPATQPAAPAAKPPKPFQLGLASYTLRNFDLDKTLAMTKRVGLKYICFKDMHLPLKATPDEIAAVVAKVQKAGLVLYGGGVISMRNKAQIDQAFDYAKAAGMKTIIAAPTVEMLPLVNEKIQQYGIAVAIHNHGPGDKIFPTPLSVYEKLTAMDRRFGLCIDIGHTVRIGADLIDSTRKCADRVLDIHMKDVTAANPKGRGIEVGRGIIDIPEFLRTLVQIKFAGAVSFEYEEQPNDPLPGLAESVGYTKGVLAVI